MTPKGIEIVVNDVLTDRTLKSLIINFGRVAFSIGRYNTPPANTVSFLHYRYTRDIFDIFGMKLVSEVT